MPPSPQSFLKKPVSVVLIGGGHTHALVLHKLREESLKNVNVTVINPGRTAPYSGMLPGFVAGHYSLAELEIDLGHLCKKVGARLIDGRVVTMDPIRKNLILEEGTSLSYDIASIDVGITTEMAKLAGFAAHGVPAKPLSLFAARWQAYLCEPSDKSVVIIGGGIAGTELSLAISHALRNDLGQTTITVIDRGEILSRNSRTVRRKLRQEMIRAGVQIIEQADVQRVTRDGVELVDGAKIPAGFVLGCKLDRPMGHFWGYCSLSLSAS